MRCSKCGHMVGLITKFCPKCGTEITGKQKKKAWIRLGVWLLLFALIWVAAYFLVKKYYSPAQSYSPQIYKISVSIWALIIWGGIFLAYFIISSLVRLTIRHKVWGIITIVIILGICGTSVFYYLQWSNIKTLNNSLILLQDNLTELTAAKLIGDAIVAKKTIPGTSIQKVQSSAFLVESRLEFISVPGELQDYKQSIQEWAKAVSASADDTKTWKDLKNNPGDFNLKLSDKQVKELLKNSLEKIVGLKEFGDRAIEKKDRIAMIYIAAKLLVQQHWLDAIIHSEKAGLFSMNITSPALAYGPETRKICAGGGGPPLTINGHEWCAGVISSTHEVAYSAVQYATTQKEDAWYQSSKQLQDLYKQVPPDFQPPTFPSPIKEFMDECRANGGHISVGAGGNIPKTGLPTTESGDTCEYHTKDKNGNDIACWDYLTFSGGRYMSGSKGCEEKNLVPTMDEETMKEKTADIGGKFDGDYTYGGTTIKCSGDFVFSIPVPGGAVSVWNNMVYTNVGLLPIYGNSVVYTTSIGEQVGDVYVSANEIDTFHFFEGGFSVTYAGTVTASREGVIKVASCSGSMSGNRVK